MPLSLLHLNISNAGVEELGGAVCGGVCGMFAPVSSVGAPLQLVSSHGRNPRPEVSADSADPAGQTEPRAAG